MRRPLIIFCTIAAVLTAIALIPGILVIAAFMALIPAIILVLAPYALLVGVAFLIADLLSPQEKFTRKAAVAGLVIAGVLLTLTIVAAWCNRPLEQEVQALTQEDHDLRETLVGSRNLAIQFVTNGGSRPKSKRPKRMSGPILQQDDKATAGAIPPPARKQFCERLCLHLLFNGVADSVLVSSVSALEEDFAPPNLAEIGIRFHLERAGCRDPAIETDDTIAPAFPIV